MRTRESRRREGGFTFMEFPETESYHEDRKQYDADVLIDEIGRFFSPEEKTLFIIREDMFSDPLNFVFGLAKGDSAILSTARLDPRFYGPIKDQQEAAALFKERIVKEAIHELGHTMGLSHCEDRKCVMSFSDSIEDVDLKGRDFCGSCSKKLGLKT